MAEEVMRLSRILLVEDEPLIREMIQMMLSQKNWRIDMAENGRDALEKWEKGHFDLLLMDLQMPEMDGLEATRAIRSREAEKGQRAAIIGLTAHALGRIRDDCLEAGMDHVLTKPVRTRELVRVVEKFLQK
jgi:CheY-like chemotaxis protein